MYKRLNTVLEITWLGIIFLLPLWLNPSGYEIFQFAKALLLQFLICILMGIYLAQWIIRPKINSTINLGSSIKRSPLQISVVVFGLALVISTLLSITPYTSLWGNLARESGLVSIIAWIIFFLIVAVKMRSRAQLMRALYALTFSAGIVALVGVIQAIRPEIMPWYEFNGRVFSTIGNPLPLSGFLSMVLPVNLALAVLAGCGPYRPAEKWTRIILLLVVCCLQLTCLALAQYSITILLFIPGMLFFFLLVGIFLNMKSALVLSTVTLAALAITASMFIGQLMLQGPEQVLPEAPGADKTLAEQAGLNTLDVRVSTWKCALNVAIDRPNVPFYQDNFHYLRGLVGYGPATFIVLSQMRHPPSMKSQYTYDSVLLDQPENHYLYLWANNGLLGLICFLAIIIIFLYLGLQMLRKNRDRENVLLAACLIAGMLQYCIYILFNPSDIMQEYMLWLLAALMVAVTHIYGAEEVKNCGQEEGRVCTVSTPSKGYQGGFRKIISCLTMIVFILLGFTLTSDRFLADIKLSSALRSWSVNASQAMADFYQASSIVPGEAVYSGYNGSYTYVLAYVADNLSLKSQLLSFSTASYEKAGRSEPYVAYWDYTAGDVYSYWGSHVDPDKWADALRSYERADVLMPGNAVILDKWALALISKGDYAAAGQKLREAERSDPLWAPTYFLKGLLQAYEGHNDTAGGLFLVPVKQKLDNINYFPNVCLQADNAGSIDYVRNALSAYVRSNDSDWMGLAMVGIADAYADRIDEASVALHKSADLVPVGNIRYLKSVIKSLPVGNKDFQVDIRAILALLDERTEK